MQRKEILSGVFLNSIPAEKFNRSRISVNFITPSNRETATLMALLPAVLSRGYRECPDMKQLGIKLAKLYGASLCADSGIQGANRVVSFSITGIKDKFALDGENLTKEYMDIIFGSIFDPVLVDGVFAEDILEIEKDKLKEALESEINDKRSYCLKQARRKYFKDNPAGIEKNGYLEEIAAITSAELYDVYKQVLKTAQIEVLVLGADENVVKEKLIAELSSFEREVCQKNQTEVVLPQTAQEYTEPVDAVQGKVCLVFTAGEQLKVEDLSKMRVAVALFGGLPTSRLFMNVREKQSLCYYCAAGFAQITSTLTVDSGVEHKNAEKTKNAVLKELEKLKTGKITDDEINDTKRALQNSLKGVGDSLSSLEAWYFGEICRGTSFNPTQVSEQIDAVTADDIKKMLEKFSLSVVYTLTQGEK